jgi:DNA-binding Lrp family transcriptional regulator
MKALEPLARALINDFQGGFPISERPYSQVAAKLGTTEATLISIIAGLLEAGYLSRFGPLYDASRLGGGLSLAALSAPEPRFDEIAGIVNGFPEVAHNYRRDHRLNMWFVLATETPEALALALSRIHSETGLRVFNFPKEREFYLGLWLRLDAQGGIETVPAPGAGIQGRGQVLDAVDRALVRATQAGLPLHPRPYAELGRTLGMDCLEVRERLARMLSHGVVRRIGAVPNHYRLGLRGNGMTVWDVPDETVVELGQRLGRIDFVSHCYQRPRYPGVWRYNLFAMVHGRDRLEVLAKTEQLALLLDGQYRAHDVLFSSAVLKKTGLRLAA